jgi:pyruvate dehydrogenase E2 component (dihydrolipoamide acetyltransferase)
MPQITLGDENVVVVGWHKQPGDTIEQGEPLLEIETEKASMEVEAPFGGTLASHLCAPGDLISPGQVIATASSADEPITVTTPKRTAPPARLFGSEEEMSATAPQPRPELSLVEHGELRGIRTTRPLHALELPPDTRPEPLSRRRMAIARRLTEAATIPQFSVARDVPIDTAEAAVSAARSSGVAATLTDALLLAVGRAATAVPRVNAWLLNDTLHLFDRVSIALAVDTPDGVLAPVFHGAASLDLPSTARARADVVERARNGKLAQGEIEGATITLSNIGGLGGDSLVPVLTPPQVAVVGVGRHRVVDGTRSATFTFVGDHRALDGADGARFLSALARELQALEPQ